MARGALLVFWAWCAFVQLALAQPLAPPAHALRTTEAADTRAAHGLPLPAPGPQYIREQRGHVTWVYPKTAADESKALIGTYAATWSRIVDELGGSIDDTLEIRIGLNPDKMAELAPIGAPPPAYASGVTYPDAGLILLSLTAPESWERPDMPRLLAHELSHAALHRAVGYAPVPRWFSEGLAILQARENPLERIKLLLEANMRGELLPLERLHAAFSSRPYVVNLAYAQSASMVGFMQEGERREDLTQLIAELRRGTPFGDAVLAAYDEHLVDLEREWHREISSNSTAAMIGLVGSIWVLAPILLVIAYVRRRKAHRKRVAEMGEEEAALDRLERALQERIRTAQQQSPPPVIAIDPQKAVAAQIEKRLDMFLVSAPRTVPEPELPTVTHEGRNHTLH